ncbi:MAG: hypothetical protein ACXAB7_18260 [Candidatus Kariarchaeaceae archaeon]|jgi:hypothetical protein
MKHTFLLLAILLIVPLMVTNSHAKDVETCDCDYVVYSKFDASVNEWTNITLFDDLMYETSATDPFYDGFSAKLLMETWTWTVVLNQLDESNFFTNIIIEDNPHTVIEAQIGEKYNKQVISHINVRPDDLHVLLDGILFRFTGKAETIPVWPTDMEIRVMESYPEQYSIAVNFQRGNDLLDYVHEENATLIVSDHNVFSEPISADNPIEAIYTDSQHLSIAAGGFMTQITFPTFFGTKEYAPEDLHFTILMDNGAYLYMSGPFSDLPRLGFQGYNTYDIVVPTAPNGTLEAKIRSIVCWITFQ